MDPTIHLFALAKAFSANRLFDAFFPFEIERATLQGRASFVLIRMSLREHVLRSLQASRYYRTVKCQTGDLPCHEVVGVLRSSSCWW